MCKFSLVMEFHHMKHKSILHSYYFQFQRSSCIIYVYVLYINVFFEMYNACISGVLYINRMCIKCFIPMKPIIADITLNQI